MKDFALTLHAHQRMNARGISKKMIELVIEYGQIKGEKYFLNRAQIKSDLKRIDEQQLSLQRLRGNMIKLLDKGGVTVVSDNGKILTLYDSDSFKNY